MVAWAQAGPQETPTPAWVSLQEAPAAVETAPDGISNGLYYQLYDLQYRVTDDTLHQYGHIIYQIMDRAGLEGGARLSFEFDPSDSELFIHAINVIRDGEVLDRLELDRFTTVRRETDLQSGIVDGNLTSFIELRDVRVGDLVEYAWSREIRSPIWPGGIGTTISTQWSIPLGRQHIRIQAPADRPLSLAGNSQLEPVRTEENGWVEYIWEQSDADRVAGEANFPAGHVHWGQISVSAMPDWQSVVDWARPLYESRSALGPRSRAVLERIREENPVYTEQVTALIRYVQDDIRYVSDVTGLGSHTPRDPDTVIENGYGDCKDKALLLVALLGEMGVHASVALTDIDEGPGLPDLAPSPYAFDHAIVRIDNDGEPVWIDATWSHQGGRFPRIAAPVYMYALPLEPGQDDLERIEVANPRLPNIDLEEAFDFADLETTGVALTVETVYRDREADSFRASLARQSLAALSESYQDYYQNLYPGIAIAGPIEVEDDRDANQVTVREFYALSQQAYQADELYKSFPMRADAVLSRLETVDGTSRTAPIHLPWPFHQRHVHRFENPPVAVSGLPPVDYANDFLRFETEQSNRPNGATLTYTLQTLADRAPANEVDAYNQIARAVPDQGDLWINLESSGWLPPAMQAWVDDPANDLALGYGLLGILYLLAILGIFFGFARDAKQPEGAVFHPVNPWKFVLVSIASFNLYAVFWMWRNWRWIKKHDELSISPFGRSWFSVLFYPAQAMRIEEEADASGFSRVLVIGCAFAYSIASVATSLADRFLVQIEPAGGPISGMVLIFNWSLSLLILPAVLQVNALNREHQEVQAYNSRWNITTMVLVIYGLLFLSLSMLGAFFGG
nr:DUF3857 and transglutaminase domain-containing protein [Maricaulis parjimensis]